MTGSEWSETIAGHEAESIRPSKTGENKVSTLAQVQADTMSDEVKRLVIADQFATEWLLVTENDRDSYEQLRESAQEADNIVALSEVLREEWENLAEQVTELVRDRIGETASLFIAQMLQGQGSLPFDIIARQTLDNFKN